MGIQTYIILTAYTNYDISKKVESYHLSSRLFRGNAFDNGVSFEQCERRIRVRRILPHSFSKRKM